MEKRYSDFMLEISADELYHGLLAYGLFSDKLPPIFTGEPFYQYCMQKTDAFPDTPHSYIYYENIRNINLPRPLGIPNPMAYQLQCACLRDNWDKIQNYFIAKTATQTYKKSRIHIRKMHDEHALFKMNYSNWRIDGSPKPDISFGKRYVVKADVSSCFPSIYTHALSWALVTKTVSKRHKNDHDEWYNQLDFYTRNTTHEETHGLIIGSHISNLLSEIILSAVDKELHD